MNLPGIAPGKSFTEFPNFNENCYFECFIKDKTENRPMLWNEFLAKVSLPISSSLIQKVAKGCTFFWQFSDEGEKHLEVGG